MLDYKTIEIFTNEEARHQGRPITDAVIQYVRGLKIAARCMVFRGIAGCDESGEVATGRLEVLSFNLPIRIAIVLPAACCSLRSSPACRWWTTTAGSKGWSAGIRCCEPDSGRCDTGLDPTRLLHSSRCIHGFPLAKKQKNT